MSPKMQLLKQRIENRLDRALRERSCIYYSQLAEDLGGYAPDSKYIAMCLGLILEEDTKNNKSLRSSLVIRRDTKMPGRGFFECAREVGHKFGPPAGFWKRQVKELIGEGGVIPL